METRNGNRIMAEMWDWHSMSDEELKDAWSQFRSEARPTGYTAVCFEAIDCELIARGIWMTMEVKK